MTFPRQIAHIPLESPVHQLRTDIVYGEADGVPLRFDHYRPLGVSGPAPAVVFVHGGGWTHGDPSQAAGNGLHFAQRGIATISLSYRLAPQHRFPAALDDVRRGLRWVRAHAGELGIDADRIALLGLSAGAHLVMHAHIARGIPALAPDLGAELGGVSEEVRAVIAHYGPYNLKTKLGFEADGSDSIVSLLGPRVGEEDWVRLASPVHHAAHATAPVLLIHGTGDSLVSHRHSERMHQALLDAGKSSQLLLLDGAPHAFQLDWHGEANQRANAAMDEFLARHL